MAVAVEIPSNLYKFSLGKQSAWGTPVANPDYQIPVYEADIGPTEERQELALIEGQAFLPGKYKSKAWFEGDVTWAAHPDSNSRLFAAHFGTSSDTMTGAGDPRTHTFARKDTPLPHTMWVGRPVAGGTFEYDKGIDCVATQLVFQYTASELFKISTHIIGASTLGVATAPTPATTLFIPTSGNFGHTWARAVLKLDLAATPATTTITNLKSFTITSSYDSATFEATQNLNPEFYNQGLWSLSFEAEFIFANWQAYNNTFYGSASPSANAPQSSTAPSGALIFQIDQEPTAIATRALTITIPYIQYELGRPTPNADGSGITATMSGTLSQPPSGEPITVVQLTSIATAYS
jgi:hypothetical protein